MAEPENDLERLLDGYFDGVLTPEERLRLQQRLKNDPQARQAYWDAAQWHAVLNTWGEQAAGRIEAAGETVVPFPPRRRSWVYVTLAAAAVLVLSLVTYRGWRRDSDAPLAEVSVAQGETWPHQLRAGEYALSQGAVRFETTAGASISVAAPARFKLVAGDRIELATGRMTARMLRHGARLTVKVHDLEVTDLGTAFGVDASAAGRSLVSVFDGLVAVKSAAGAGELRLARGESLAHRVGETPEDERTHYDAAAFRTLWPLTVGINNASHLVEFLPPGPLLRPLRDYEANDRLFLFPERQAATLASPLLVDLSADVRVWPESPASPYPLPAGTRVSSYLVFFQPEPSAPGQLRHLSGEITFQHRIVGVICSDVGLDVTDAALGRGEADYSTPGQRRGFEEADKENYRGGRLPHDRLSIGPDGRTVHFDLYVADEREQMRVLVDAP